jgi:hypothetical protein
MFDSLSEDQSATTFVAIVSIIAGLVSILIYPFSGLLALAGLALGCYILVKSRRNPPFYSAGSAKWIIVGSLIALFLFAAIAAPNVLTTQSAENETVAVTSIRLISKAEREFAKRLVRGRYGTLTELAEVGLVDQELADGTESGYRFWLRLKANGGFEALAVPVKYGSVFGTGTRSFYLDESGVLRQAVKGGCEASVTDEVIGD